MIPVVFIHFGECEYAPATLAQAKARGNEVVFLNPPRDALYDYPFAQSYEHLSTNHVYFELACMVRWFVLRDWMVKEGIPDCLYCDTDVLLYTNVEHEIHSDPYYHAQDFTLSLGTSGHTSYWKVDALDTFCDFLERTYARKESDETFRELKRIFNEMQAQGLAGGIVDMTLLKMFAAWQGEIGGWDVGEMSVIRDGKTWQHNINDSAEGFEMEGGRQRIMFVNGEPFAHHLETERLVRLLSLHMQGGAKIWIPQFADTTRS